MFLSEVVLKIITAHLLEKCERTDGGLDER